MFRVMSIEAARQAVIDTLQTLQREPEHLTADDYFAIAEDLQAVAAYANKKGEALETAAEEKK